MRHQMKHLYMFRKTSKAPWQSIKYVLFCSILFLLCFCKWSPMIFLSLYSQKFAQQILLYNWSHFGWLLCCYKTKFTCVPSNACNKWIINIQKNEIKSWFINNLASERNTRKVERPVNTVYTISGHIFGRFCDFFNFFFLQVENSFGTCFHYFHSEPWSLKVS